MKKQILIITLILVLLLSVTSCRLRERSALVIITNIGNVPIYASVDGAEEYIPPYQSTTWEVIWEEDNSVMVILEAEPAEYQGYDTETVLLYDNETYQWETGWDVLY
ncbi:MAG: hypothetical protein ABFR75_13205 [Acidobacteriota bacterium]